MATSGRTPNFDAPYWIQGDEFNPLDIGSGYLVFDEAIGNVSTTANDASGIALDSKADAAEAKGLAESATGAANSASTLAQEVSDAVTALTPRVTSLEVENNKVDDWIIGSLSNPNASVFDSIYNCNYAYNSKLKLLTFFGIAGSTTAFTGTDIVTVNFSGVAGLPTPVTDLTVYNGCTFASTLTGVTGNSPGNAEISNQKLIRCTAASGGVAVNRIRFQFIIFTSDPARWIN